MSKFYTVKQVATLLGVSTNTVYKYVEEGQIKATRLGKNGRFRVSEKVLQTILGSKELEQITTREDLIVAEREQKTLPEPTSTIQVEKSAILNTFNLNSKISNPDLFDWFMSLSAIFIGIVHLFHPINLHSFETEPLRISMLIIRIGLVISGLILLYADLFVSGKRIHHHIIARAPLFIFFAFLTFLLVVSKDTLNATPILVLSLFTLVSMFWHKNSTLKFLLLVYFLLVFSGLLFAKFPRPFFFFDPREFVENYPGIFEALWFVLSTAFLALLLYTSKNSKALFLIFCILTSAFFLIISTNLITYQAWGRGVVALLISAFCLILPFKENIDSLSKFSRKEALMAFGWITLVLFIGIGIVNYTQTSFKQIILSEFEEHSNASSRIVEAFVSESRDSVQSYAQNPIYASLIKDYQNAKGKKKLDSQNALSVLTREIFLGSNTLRRLSLFDSKGELISTYPVSPQPFELNISNNQLFTQVSSTNQTFITTSLHNQKPSVYITTAIFDSENKIIGVVSGMIDLALLSDRLSIIGIEDNGYIALADSSSVILLHEKESLVGKKAEINSGLITALKGDSGIKDGFTEVGEPILQSYSPVKSLGWGLVTQESFSHSLSQSSILSFSIFMFTISTGIGALLLLMYTHSKMPFIKL